MTPPATPRAPAEAWHRALPPPPPPAAHYVPVRQAGNLLHAAGQTPHVRDTITHRGRVGAEVSLDDARDLAAQAALNALSALVHHVGDVQRISHLVSLTVFIASAADFTQHPLVANGASDALVDLLGDDGRHARAAVGVASLPDGAPVEVSLVAYLRDDAEPPPHHTLGE